MEKYVSGDRVCGETFLSCGLLQWGGIDEAVLQFCSGCERGERGQREGEEDGRNDKDGRFIKGEQRNRDNDIKEKRGLEGGYGR